MQNTRNKIVTKPMMSFKMKDGSTINVWVLDAGQRAELAKSSAFHFGDDKTASLIYERIGNGHQATEEHIYHAGTWAWIQEWMTGGLIAAGEMKEQAQEGAFENPVLHTDNLPEFKQSALSAS